MPGKTEPAPQHILSPRSRWVHNFWIYSLIFLILTVLTQVGGVILLLSLPFLSRICLSSHWQQSLMRTLVFLLIYTTVAFTAIPALAGLNGRVPLPCNASSTVPIKATHPGYCLLMRNYVTPTVKARLINHAQQFRRIHLGGELRYLDANFPFWNGFPLIPHLSHHDGRKVDLAYFYQRKDTRQPIDFSPIWLGYWFYEQPYSPGQAACRDQTAWLRWDFDSLQQRYNNYTIDEQRTRTLLRLISQDATKILLEPHLKQRLASKLPHQTIIRFQGCHAARHDDHLHVQW